MRICLGYVALLDGRWSCIDLLQLSNNIADDAFLKGLWAYSFVVGEKNFPEGLFGETLPTAPEASSARALEFARATAAPSSESTRSREPRRSGTSVPAEGRSLGRASARAGARSSATSEASRARSSPPSAESARASATVARAPAVAAPRASPLAPASVGAGSRIAPTSKATAGARIPARAESTERVACAPRSGSSPSSGAGISTSRCGLHARWHEDDVL